MNEPSQGQQEVLALIQKGFENRYTLKACKKHHFFPILDQAGDHYGHYRCVNCTGEINQTGYDMYQQGVRDGQEQA